MAFSTLNIWRSFYNNESISTLEEFDNEIKHYHTDFDNLVSKAKSTVYGIEFVGINKFNLDHLNPFSCLSIFAIFLKNLSSNKNKKILIATDFGNAQGQNLKNLLVRYANKAKFEVFTHNYDTINEFLFYKTIETTGINNGIFLSYNQTQNKYYLKLVKDKIDLKLQEYIFYLSEFTKINNLFLLSPSSQSTIINVDKILKLYCSNFKTNFTSKTGDFELNKTLKISIIVSNSLDLFILQRILNNSSYKVVIYKRNISNKMLFTILDLNFGKHKTDLIIHLNEAKQLKIYAKVKSRYITLKEEDLIYLFINYNFLTWKNDSSLELNQVYLPFYVPKFILNLLINFKIPYDNNQNIALGTNNVLLSYTHNKFSANLGNQLNYSNFDFILKLSKMFLDYKNNNYLFGYKYLKTLESKFNFSLSTKEVNFEYYEALEALNIFEVGKVFLKSIKLTKIQQHEFENREQHDLLEVTFKYKEHSFYMYAFYDFNKKNLVLKFESELAMNYSKTKRFLVRIIHKFLQWVIIKNLNKFKKETKNAKKTKMNLKTNS